LYKRGHCKFIKPNVQTFTCVINAWARSREKHGGERAEALLDQMIKLYENDPKNSNVMPNVLTLHQSCTRMLALGPEVQHLKLVVS